MAQNLIIDAGTGIGSGDAIETQVSNLAARVTGASATGNIEIANTGDLVLADLNGWGYSVQSSGSGTISITTNSNLTIGAPVNSGGGNIRLAALSGSILDATPSGLDISELVPGVGLQLVAASGIGNTGAIKTNVTDLAAFSTTGPVNINEQTDLNVATVTVGLDSLSGITTAGSINLAVGGNLTQKDGNDIISNSGDIVINTLSLTQDVASQINALPTGNVTITTTGGNITVDRISGSEVVLSSSSAVTDNNGSGVNNITAGLMVVTAPDGINLDTNVNTFEANTSGGNGSIIISNAGGLTLNDVNAGTGDVTFTLAAGALNSNFGAKITGDEVFLTAPDGINVNSNINALTASTVTSNIAVTEDNGLTLNNINAGTGDVTLALLAGTLTSNAGTKITGNNLAINGVGAVNVNTNVNTLTASTTNANIAVQEDNGLGLNLVNAGTGDVSIILAAGAITDNNGTQKNIIGNNLVLQAVDGIGSGDALETTVSTLTASNTNNGIEIFNQGVLSIVSPGVHNTNGWIYITTFSPLNVNADVIGGGDIYLQAGDNDTVPTDNLAIAANVNVQSTTGNVLLKAGDDITQAAGIGVISAGGGNISLIAGHDNDSKGLIDMEGKVGSGNENLNMQAKESITAITNVATLSASTTNADITITEDNGLALNNVNAGTGDVTLTLLAGMLTSNAGIKITSNTATLTAPAGINVNTNINTLTASTTNANITITEDNSLALNNVNAGPEM